MANRALLTLACLGGALLANACGGKGLSGSDGGAGSTGGDAVAGTTGAAGTTGVAGTTGAAGTTGLFTPPATCSLPFDSGPCEAAFRVYAAVNGQCVERVYGGCQGNANRFYTMEECLMTCEGRPGSRACPAGRVAAEACLQCGLAGGCRTSEACALSCTKHEDCAAAGDGYTCGNGVCGLVCI